MCNIAGYVGNRNAAPILIDMMSREEGFSGGYYTGIATVSENRIYMEKRTGDLNCLCENTPAGILPGTTGIIHSRSKSGGGDEWAHPFPDGFHKEPLIAYVANGYAGCCSERKEEKIRLAEKFISEGCTMSSRVTDMPDAYTDLPDGSSIHMSDLMCQAIARNITDGLPADAAIDRAFCEVPSEVVGLLVHKERTDRIYFGRYNFPMFAAFCEHGAYLSSTPLAFPDDAVKVIPVPEGTYGYLTPDRLEISPLSAPAFTVAEENALITAKAYTAIENALSQGWVSFPDLSHLVKPMFTGADCGPYIHETHKVLWSLKKQGRLVTDVKTVPGAKEGLTAPLFIMKLI